MDRKRIEELLTADEGKRLNAYKDSLGKPTIGIGHLIVPADYIPIDAEINDERCDSLFQADLDKAIAGAQRLLPQFSSLPEPVQEAIVNMVFNLGETGLSKFPRFLNAIRSRDWKAAVMQLDDTPWHRQVGPRADRIIAAIAACPDDEYPA
jgi:GH24 family phage-related lysozyme (muramidase)